MSAYRIRTNTATLARFAEDLLAVPTQPIGEHLDDEQMSAYVIDALSADEMARVDQHVASCEECALTAASLAEGMAYWQGATLDAAKERLRRRKPQSETPHPEPAPKAGARARTAVPIVTKLQLMFSFQPGLALAAADPEEVTLTSTDRRFSVLFIEDDQHEFHIRAWTDEPGHVGDRLRLEAGEWSTVLTLGPVQGAKAGAFAILSKDERLRIGDHEIAAIELIHEELADES